MESVMNMHREPTIDKALAAMYRKVEKKAQEILAEEGSPIVNAYRVVALVKEWEKARDSLGKLDDMV